jgi:hypothetical protein
VTPECIIQNHDFQPATPNASHHSDNGFHTVTTQSPQKRNEEANTSNPQTNLGTNIRAMIVGLYNDFCILGSEWEKHAQACFEWNVRAMRHPVHT